MPTLARPVEIGRLDAAPQAEQSHPEAPRQSGAARSEEAASQWGMRLLLHGRNHPRPPLGQLTDGRLHQPIPAADVHAVCVVLRHAIAHPDPQVEAAAAEEIKKRGALSDFDRLAEATRTPPSRA